MLVVHYEPDVVELVDSRVSLPKEASVWLEVSLVVSLRLEESRAR